MIEYLTETIKIEKVQYVCDKCGIKSKRILKGEKHIPTGWAAIGFLIHYCPMCASKVNSNN